MSRLCARAPVFMYVLVGDSGSNDTIMYAIDAIDPTAAMEPTTTRTRARHRVANTSTSGHTR